MRFLLLAGLLGAADVPAQLEPIWKSVMPKVNTKGPPVIWGYRLTPAIPAEWPPKSNEAPVVRYVVAFAQDASLRDGERTSAPFAVVELAVDGTASVKQLTRTLEKIEVQGVRPITKDEADRQSGDLVDAARSGQMSAMRAAWCGWKKNAGVVTQHVAARHKAFFDALQCESVKSAK